MENEDAANYSVRFRDGATGAIALSRRAHGHPNTLRFEVFCERGGAVYDARTPAEILLVDAEPGRGFRRVLLGPEHALIAHGLPFDGASIGFGHNEAFVFQARAFLDEVHGDADGLTCPPLAHGLHNLSIQEAVVESAELGARVELQSGAVSR